MDIKEFKKITKKTFESYGFKTEGKCYYLDLEDILIVACLYPMHGSHILLYNFSIKAIHTNSERKKNDFFSGFDCRPCYTYDINGKHFIDYTVLSAADYTADLTERILRYFEPFKENALDYISNARFIPDKNSSSHRFMITKKAQEYLGIDLSK